VDDAQVQAKVSLTFEAVKPGQLQPPDAATVGYPQAQKLLLRAFRLSMMHSTAPFLALHRSRVIPVSYQLVPVVMSLQQPRVRLLIADDVGLGKTIEAGLVISELMARGQARRVLVICPASLREQWQDALDRFFHIVSQLFSRQHRRSLERDLPAGINPWEFHNVFIVSVDYAKMPEIKNQLLEVPWDIVVIDEAQHELVKVKFLQSSGERIERLTYKVSPRIIKMLGKEIRDVSFEEETDHFTPHPSELTVEKLVEWFFENYKDPADGVPWDGEDKEYYYAQGGPYHADEELFNHFPDLDENIIFAATEVIESTGLDWVKQWQY
jgi:SNF2 family DNA or RNA helicase